MNLKKLKDQIRLVRFVPVAAAVTVLAVFGSGGAAAADDSIPDPIVDPCLLVPADATLWLGQGIPRVQATAPESYPARSRPCKRFVVDIQVPANSSGGWGYTSAFSIEILGQGCSDTWKRWDYVYRKSGHGSTFKHLGHVHLYGDETPTGCHVEAFEQNDDPWPAAFDPRKQDRIATYRVVTVSGHDWRAYWPYYSFMYTLPTVRASHLPVI